jgi:hypothetical protein
VDLLARLVVGSAKWVGLVEVAFQPQNLQSSHHHHLQALVPEARVQWVAVLAGRALLEGAVLQADVILV